VDEQSLAHHAHPETTARILRGLALYRDRGSGIEPQGHGTYSVPGCDGGSYTVGLDVFADQPVETCSCPDFQRRRDVCKHIVAATLYRARSRAQSRSRSRVHKYAPDAVAANLARLTA
jgi:hypothetical protein